MSRGAVVARSPGLTFDDVALAGLSEGQTLAAWSDARGVWMRRLDADSRPLGEPRRVTERCAGGLSLEAHRDGFWLGCSRPGSKDGAAVLYAVSGQGALRATHALGSVGRDGRGIALAVHERRVDVLYHEGSLGRHVLHFAHLDLNSKQLSDRVVSAPERIGAEPFAASHGKHTYFAWSETPLAQDAGGATQVWAMRDDGSPRMVLESQIEAPSPGLYRDGDELLLWHRDRKRRDKRPELYVVPLHTSLQVKKAPQRVGRANSRGAPSLLTCGPLRAAVLPREYGGEHYVAVHSLDAQHQNLGGGHQYYESNREFVFAAATCSKGQLALLIGERAHPAKPGVELISLRYACRGN